MTHLPNLLTLYYIDIPEGSILHRLTTSSILISQDRALSSFAWSALWGKLYKPLVLLTFQAWLRWRCTIDHVALDDSLIAWPVLPRHGHYRRRV